MKKVLMNTVRVLFTLGGLVFIVLVFRDNFDEVVGILKSFYLPLFVAASAAFLIIYALMSVRLKWILKAQDVTLSWGRLFYLSFVGHFFNLFLPSAIGGDVVKGYYICKQSGKNIASISSVFLDRLVGGFVSLAIAVVMILVLSGKAELETARNAVLIVFGVAVCGLLVFVSRRVARGMKALSFLIPTQKLKDFLSRINSHLHNFRERKGVLLRVCLITVAAQTVFILIHLILARSLAIDLPFYSVFLAVPMITALSMAPSINGLGVREAAFVYFFGWFTTQEKALALSLVYDGMIYVLGLLFGIIYLMREGMQMNVIREAVASNEAVENAGGA